MKKALIGTCSAICMFAFILDGKTAIYGAQEGITLCLQSVIPALFPFLILSNILCQSIMGNEFTILRPLGRLAGIPQGAESLMLLGFLGGYPVGAQNIHYAVNTGAIDRKTAQRMLGFCNNAGPAFIFGMAAGLFSSPYASWALWLTHMISAILVAIVLPNRMETVCTIPKTTNDSVLTIFQNSIRIMGNICGWVVIFRIIIAFFKRWFLWLLPMEMQVFISGLLELTNGIFLLTSIPVEGLRFVMCAAMLSLGGLCVAMQTIFVTGSLGCGYYFPGKLLQGVFSFILALLLQPLLFKRSDIFMFNEFGWVVILLVPSILLILLHRLKNNSRNLAPSLI